MGMKIIISSAVVLKEKNYVYDKLRAMEAEHLIKIDKIYDCNRSGTFWNVRSKQEMIDCFIAECDWFICLVPDYVVGQATWGELQYVIDRKKQGAPVAISVFHPLDFPESAKIKEEDVPKGKILFSKMEEEANKLLGSQKEQYSVPYKYNDIDDLLLQLEKAYQEGYEEDKAFWSQHIGYFVKSGGEIEAGRLFFDSNRASQEWGFREGSENYIWRQSVDGKLNQKLEETEIKFLFVTGKPTSGKSRAIYECLHSTLKDKNVVVMKSDNIMIICQNLQIEIEQYRKYNGLPQRFEDNDYIFVCDQINDVFRQARVPNELRLSFLRIIDENKNCKLLATGTRNSLDSFVADSKGIISPLEKVYGDGNSSVITIPSISKDVESLDILAFLHQNYAVTGGETIGDFIHELNDKKQEIVKGIYEEANKNPYLPKLLKAFQLILVYRNVTALLLPISILRKCYPKVDPSEFKERTKNCLEFLIDKNVVKITDTEYEEKEIIKFPDNVFSESRYCMPTFVEDEKYDKLVPSSYTFTVNELVWDYLLEMSEANDEKAILYDLYKREELENAMSLLFDSYPHAATLRRLVSRVPKRIEWQDKQENEARLRTAWNFSKNMLKELFSPEESVEELTKLFNILIGRAQSVEEVDSILEIMSKHNIETDDSTIGEMYKFALQRLNKDSNEFKDFIKRVSELNEAQQKRDSLRGHAWTYTDFYRVKWQMVLFSDNYDKAFNLVFNSLYNLTHVDREKKSLKGKDAVCYISRQINSFEKRNLDMLIGQLARSCKNINEIYRLIKCHQCYQIQFTPFVLHCIGKVLKNGQSMERIIDAILPTPKDKKDNGQLYESMVAYFVPYLSTFTDSINLYNKWHCDLRVGDNHNVRLVSLCLRNCQREEFQSALGFVNRMPKSCVNGIMLNLLVSVAPNPEEALCLVNSMKPSDVDEYTLCNCLRCIDTVKQMNMNRGDAKIPPEQIFIMTYEIINHPKLKALRTRPRCLQKIFRLVSFREQEHYVMNIAQGIQREIVYNAYIGTTRTSYRNFCEAYEEIYEKAIDEYIDIRGTITPDLFNAMCAKMYKDKDLQSQDKKEVYAEKLRTDIQRLENGSRGGKLIRDEFFFLNYYIEFQGEPLFTDDAMSMSSVFMDWFKGKIGNYDPFNLDILPRYFDYILSQKEIPAEKRWLRALTIYKTYAQFFETYKRTFAPDSLVFVNMFKIVEKCANRDECLKFIDQELEKLNIRRDLRLNYYLQYYESEYHFEYNVSHPQPLNRQKENIDTIKKSVQTEQIMAVLKQEIETEGFVTPSVVNTALSQYRDFQKMHNQTLSQFLDEAKKILPNAHYFNLKYLVKSCSINFNKRHDKRICNSMIPWWMCSRKLKNQHGCLYAEACPFNWMCSLNLNTKYNERIKMALRIQQHYADAKTWEQLKEELNALCKRLDKEQFEEIVHFIECHHLEDKLTLRGIATLALLAKNAKERLKWLKKLEQSEEINENIFGTIATEPVIAHTDMSISRKYFMKWLAIYQDIYGDISIIVKFLNLNERRWSTLGLHLKNEITELTYLRKSSKLTAPNQLQDFYDYLKKEGKTVALDTISLIMRFYEFCPQYNISYNYTKLLSFDDAINLLIAHTGNIDYWKKMSKPITK